MKKLLMMFAVLSAVLLAGCTEDLYVDQAFVGTWHWTDNVQYTYVFASDGTGQRGDAQIQSFTWGTRDGLLVLDHGPAFRDDELTYTFDGDMLNLSGEGGNFNYFRSVPNPSFIGDWVIFGDYMVGKTVNADGTGHLLHFLGGPGEEVAFNWFTANDLLIVQVGPMAQDMWTYSISGDTLNLVSRQVTGYTQEFVRGSFSQNPALLGEWAWDQDDDWQYYFGANAIGESGWIGDEEMFFWTTFENRLIMLRGAFYETWSFTITGDVLELVNLHDPAQRFSYVRVR